MASWAGAYGAGGASDALKEFVAQKFMERRQAEVERATRAQESFAQQELAAAQEREARREALQREEVTERQRQFGLTQEQRNAELRERRIDRTMDEQKRAMERADDREAGLEGEERQFGRQKELLTMNQAFQNKIMGAQRAAQAESAQLAAQEKREKLAREEADRTQQTTRAQESTQQAYDTVKRLLDPNDVGRGIGAAYGAYESGLTAGLRGQGQNREDFGAERDKLVAMLALPNLGMLKGPMSDKDLLFIKQVSSKLANENISEGEARKELVRVKQFLQDRGAMDTAAAMVKMQAPNGAVQSVPADQVAHFESRGAKRVP